jgi:hypothetical protein
LGILWPHSNSIIRTNADQRAAGAKIYFFEAGTTTPRTAYQDADLTTPHTHPVIADAYGRAPAIFLDFSDYRERVRTSGDTTLWDTDDIPNAAPVEPDSGLTEDSFQALQTGQIIFAFENTTFDGFVRCNGRTIGSATSGASERANADCEALFLYLHNCTSNAQLAVPGGRGANAAADWAANKTIALPDGRSAGLIGFDDMGASAAGRVSSAPTENSGDGVTEGSIIGANTHTLLTAQMPAHAHSLASVTAVSNGAHTHSISGTASSNGAHTHSVTIPPGEGSHTHTASNSGGNFWREVGAGGGFGVGGGTNTVTQANTGTSALPEMSGSAASDGAHTHPVSGTAVSDGAHTHTLTGSMETLGSGTAHNILSRSLPVTVLMKL